MYRERHSRECDTNGRSIMAKTVDQQIEDILTAMELMPEWRSRRGILKKCVNSQAVYPLSEQHGLKARERRYTAHEEGKHWE